MTHIEKMRLQAALKTTSGECNLLRARHSKAPDSPLLRQRERQGRSEERVCYEWTAVRSSIYTATQHGQPQRALGAVHRAPLHGS